MIPSRKKKEEDEEKRKMKEKGKKGKGKRKEGQGGRLLLVILSTGSLMPPGLTPQELQVSFA